MTADRVAPEIVRISVVSDVRIYRDGIVAAFANAPGLGCVAIARLGITGLNDILGTRPDVVVVDMGAREALDLVRALRRAMPAARVVAFGVDESEAEVLACAEAGVAGYVCRDSTVDALLDIVRRTANDESSARRASPRRCSGGSRRWPSGPSLLPTR